MPTKTMKTLAVSASALLIAQVAFPVTLSELTHDYDVIVEGDTTRGSRVHGSLAVGGNLTIGAGDFSVNDDGDHTSTHSLVVGGQIVQAVNGGSVSQNGAPRGTVRVGSLNGNQSLITDADRIRLVENDGVNPSKTFNIYNENQSTADMVDNSVIDFSSTFDALKTLSDCLQLLPTNYDPGPSGQNSIFAFDFGSTIGAGLKVVNIAGADLFDYFDTNLANGVANDLANGVRYVVNVDLTDFNDLLGVKFNQNVPDSFASGILWNFFGNDTVQIKSKWVGSILAPEVAITDLTSGDIRGSVVAKEFTKLSGQIHPGSFDYDFDFDKPNPAPPAVPDSGSTALLVMLGLPLLAWVRARIAKQ